MLLPPIRGDSRYQKVRMRGPFFFRHVAADKKIIWIHITLQFQKSLLLAISRHYHYWRLLSGNNSTQVSGSGVQPYRPTSTKARDNSFDVLLRNIHCV